MSPAATMVTLTPGLGTLTGGEVGPAGWAGLVETAEADAEAVGPGPINSGPTRNDGFSVADRTAVSADGELDADARGL